ncbi:hypothetical protein [Ruegeria sp. HKCCA6837]|uniref:hypothetical protein n=1 Tax=Ruegeria sp. HKCCA6837 TaxID=2682989 RepID=UPI0014891481|nr:hypothetical protein [Ruegeria sp. HKCCA6837]
MQKLEQPISFVSLNFLEKLQNSSAIDNLFARFIATPLLARPGLEVPESRARLFDLLIQVRHFVLPFQWSNRKCGLDPDFAPLA